MKQWIIHGLIWGVIMYVLMTFIFPFTGIDKNPVTLKKSLIAIPVWLLSGLLFGYITHKINSRQTRNKS